MTKEIIDRDNPHKDIGKKKFRVRKYYTAWVEYDVVADSRDEADTAVMEHCGIEKIDWAEGYHLLPVDIPLMKDREYFFRVHERGYNIEDKTSPRTAPLT